MRVRTRQAVSKFDAVHRLTKEIAPNEIELALTPADVVRIAKTGKKVAVIGIENAYPIGTDIKRGQGVLRPRRPVHVARAQRSQPAGRLEHGRSQQRVAHNGLSALGKQVIAEMNRLGIMVDLSHPSKTSNMQAMALSKAPVIASHSSARALANHSRNMDDEQLMALKKNGGVIQTVAFASYVKVEDPAIATRRGSRRLAALNEEFGVAAAPAAGGGAGGRGAGGGRGDAAAAGRGDAGGRARRGSRRRRRWRGRVRRRGSEQPRTPAAAARRRGGGGGRGGGGVDAAALAALSPERRAEYDKRMADVAGAISADAARQRQATSSITSTTSSRRSASITSASPPTSTAAAAWTAGTARPRRSTSRSSSCAAATPRRRSRKIWSGNLLRVWAEVEKVARGIQAGTIK